MFLPRKIFKLFNESEILGAAAFTLLIRIVGAFAAFAFQLVVARKLGASGAGIFYFTTSILVLTATAGRLGLDRVLPRFIAPEKNSEGTFTSNGSIFFSIVTTLILSSTLALLTYGASYLSIPNFKIEYYEPMRIGSLFIVAISLFWLSSGILIGRKQSIIASSVQTLILPVVGIIILMAIYQDQQPTPSEAIIAYGLGCVISAVIGLSYVFFRADNTYMFSNFNILNSLEIIKPGVRVMVSDLSTQFTLYTPLLFLGLLGTAADTGIFAIAQRLALVVGLVLYASNIVLAPRLANMWSNNRKDDIENLASVAATLMIILSLPINLFLIFAPTVVLNIFGDGFESGAPILIILATAQIFTVYTSSIEQVLIMTGKDRTLMFTSIMAAGICLVASWVLIPQLGGTGAAFAFSIAMVFRNITRILLFKLDTGINVLPKVKHFMNPYAALQSIKSY